jgi:hypothetical protein
MYMKTAPDYSSTSARTEVSAIALIEPNVPSVDR